MTHSSCRDACYAFQRTPLLDCNRGPAPSQCRSQRSAVSVMLSATSAHCVTEDPNNQNPSKWHAIAKHVPNRTNKDCRKRWFAKMASDVVKGGWAPEEDERLIKGIEHYGTRYDYSHPSATGHWLSFLRWSLVASVVQSRNSDRTCSLLRHLHSNWLFSSECAKRWTDTLNPAIDRTTWTSEAVSFPRFISNSFADHRR